MPLFTWKAKEKSVPLCSQFRLILQSFPRGIAHLSFQNILAPTTEYPASNVGDTLCASNARKVTLRKPLTNSRLAAARVYRQTSATLSAGVVG
jgi:hypothetical protein